MVDRIRELCERQGITLHQLEQAIELKSTIARWEDHAPSIDKVQRVARYFGVLTSYLLDEIESPASISADGLKSSLSIISTELREQFVRFLALSKEDPERAARYLVFANQELESRK